ncbi:transposase [Mesorhizobium cantuariense]|uniref:Transposase n=1 Tax=Mesorhizobium cantuariense TaxID=1300275 RepID=A0ABV7MYM3_9HYPH
MVLKTRGLLVRQRTQAINALRAHLSELGIIASISSAKIAGLIEIVRDETDTRLPKAARLALSAIADQIEALMRQIDDLEREIAREARRDEDMRRMATIPGVGAITAASIKALVPDPGGFKSGRHFAAWLGLTPKSHSSGGKERLGGAHSSDRGQPFHAMVGTWSLTDGCYEFTGFLSASRACLPAILRMLSPVMLRR